MMRGNRQGNNAFLEEPVHTVKTPIEYILDNPYSIEKIFARDTVTP